SVSSTPRRGAGSVPMTGPGSEQQLVLGRARPRRNPNTNDPAVIRGGVVVVCLLLVVALEVCALTGAEIARFPVAAHLFEIPLVTCAAGTALRLGKVVVMPTPRVQRLP
ncbi:hypothetical protein, partial [Streptomyces violarus]|uniref:hypothetical protein n=1 Tax=Streptomyces violarus TaxID=67380 RepID=UPI0021C21B2F